MSSGRGRPTASLLRAYLLLSLVVTLAVTGGLTVATRALVSQDLLRKDRALAEQLARFLYGQIVEHLPQERDAESPEAAFRATFAYVTGREASRSGLRIANLIDEGGTILCSTRPEWVGRTVARRGAYAAALAGHAGSELKHEGTRFDLGGEISEPLLESYVRIGEIDVPGRGRTAAVIEVYQSARSYIDELRRSQRLVLLIALTSLGLMFLAHLWLFLKGNRTIAARSHELEKLSQTLERQVEDRTRELATSRRLADVGFLAAGLAHEINTPLASIATCADGLLRRGVSDDQRSYLEIIRKEAFRVKKITRSLLDFSRARPAEETLRRRRPLAVAAVLGEVRDLFAFEMDAKEVRLEIALDPPEVQVLADPTDLHQILLNVTRNSLDAVGRGGTIRWSAAIEGESVRVRCADDGVGIDPALLDQVMDPFVTTKDASQGTGLGLSTAYALARRQGGMLSIDSPGPGGGAVVSLILPAAVPEGPEARATAPPLTRP